MRVPTSDGRCESAMLVTATSHGAVASLPHIHCPFCTADATTCWLCRSEDDPEQNPIQEAVVRVFNRIVDSTNPGLEPAQVFMGRMLLLPPQVL